MVMDMAMPAGVGHQQLAAWIDRDGNSGSPRKPATTPRKPPHHLNAAPPTSTPGIAFITPVIPDVTLAYVAKLPASVAIR